MEYIDLTLLKNKKRKISEFYKENNHTNNSNSNVPAIDLTNLIDNENESHSNSESAREEHDGSDNSENEGL